VPLPTYPFQRRRYWVDGGAGLISPPAAVVTGRIDDLDRWTYVPTWRNEPATVADHSDEVRAAGAWLVFAAGEPGEAIVGHLRAAGADVTVVRSGSGFATAPNGDLVIKPGCLDDAERMLTSLASMPTNVIHAFCLGSGADRESGYGTAVALAGAYASVAPDRDLNLLVVTEGAVSVAGEAPSRPDHAAVVGLLPVLAQENPGWVCRQVDLGPPGPEPALASLAAAVVAEALGPRQGPIALRGRSRWRRSFVPLPLPAPADDVLPEGSVVLITGGLGYVGLILARHLTLERRCRVVLTARTPLPARENWEQFALAGAHPSRQVGALLELEQQGGQFLVVAADVADQAQMRAAIAQAEERFGPIDVVVHAAGISDGSGFGPAHLVSRAGTDQHFTAKVAGFQVLREAFAGRDVRGITLSSLSAVLGGIALGPYSAANAALDAHVLAARGCDGLRWITVDWDTWGKGSGPDLPPPGDYDMAPAEAVKVFERALAAVDAVDHVVISTGPLDPRFQLWVVDAGMGADAASEEDVERDPRPDLSTPFVEPAEGTECALADIWARVLRLQSVGAEDDFFGLGGNSVLAIEVVGRIRKGLRLPIPTSAVMGYPTVRGLATQIDEMRQASVDA
jgi:NAD(P)-dependent dehydrogenase (short-subunit alcohol dehydrogenase family)